MRQIKSGGGGLSPFYKTLVRFQPTYILFYAWLFDTQMRLIEDVTLTTAPCSPCASDLVPEPTGQMEEDGNAEGHGAAGHSRLAVGRSTFVLLLRGNPSVYISNPNLPRVASTFLM